MDTIKKYHGFVAKRDVIWYGNEDPKKATLTMYKDRSGVDNLPMVTALLLVSAEVPEVILKSELADVLNGIMRRIPHDINIDAREALRRYAAKHNVELD